MTGVPKISVITACYNHGKYVGEMIGSVMRQSFQELEMIIVDDGSTDNTAEILDSIQNPKIRIIHTENKGPASARNLAIENAGAELIMNLDADDLVEPTLFEKAYNVFVSHPDAGIVYSDAECFGAKTGKYEIGEFSVENMLYDNRIISQAFFRKKDWKIVGGYSTELTYGLEDWDFWLQILELGRKAYKIPQPLVYYRTYVNPNECRTGRMKKDRMKTMESLFTIYQHHLSSYQKYPEIERRFMSIGKKLQNENFILKLLKNSYYKYVKRL